MKEVIEKVLNSFNFEKVHGVMELTNWTWVQSSGKVPSVAIMKDVARGLLADVSYMDAGSTVSTGGFRASKTLSGFGEDVKEILSLEFVLEQSEYC